MSEITVTLPDGSARTLPEGATTTDLARGIGPRLASEFFQRVTSAQARTTVARERIPDDVGRSGGAAREQGIEGDDEVDALVKAAFAKLGR